MLSNNILHPSWCVALPQPYELFYETTNMGHPVDARKLLGKRLGQRIADRRKSIAWTQDQLAERLGVDAETISRFERGVTVPSLVTLDRLARVLNSSSADLLSEASITPSDQAIQISAWLAGLSSEDNEFVVSQIKALCDHIQRKSRL